MEGGGGHGDKQLQGRKYKIHRVHAGVGRETWIRVTGAGTGN